MIAAARQHTVARKSADRAMIDVRGVAVILQLCASEGIRLEVRLQVFKTLHFVKPLQSH